MQEHGDDSGPKHAKKKDNEPSDFPCYQPQDQKTPRRKFLRYFYNIAYQMHIENWEILSRGGWRLRLIPEKASENEVQGQLPLEGKDLNESEAAGKGIAMTRLFN